MTDSTDTPDVVETAKAELGYDDIWFKLGVIDRPELLSQYKQYKECNKNLSAEHYRYTAFCNFVNAKAFMEKPVFESAIKVAQHEAKLDGPNTFLFGGFSALKDHPGLTIAQCKQLLSAVESTDLEKHVQQKLWQKRAQAGDQSVDFIEQCLRSGNDQTVRSLMADCESLERHYLVRIANAGPTKAVRNIAKERLKQFHRHDGFSNIKYIIDSNDETLNRQLTAIINEAWHVHRAHPEDWKRTQPSYKDYAAAQIALHLAKDRSLIRHCLDQHDRILTMLVYRAIELIDEDADLETIGKRP